MVDLVRAASALEGRPSLRDPGMLWYIGRCRLEAVLHPDTPGLLPEERGAGYIGFFGFSDTPGLLPANHLSNYQNIITRSDLLWDIGRCRSKAVLHPDTPDCCLQKYIDHNITTK